VKVDVNRGGGGTEVGGKRAETTASGILRGRGRGPRSAIMRVPSTLEKEKGISRLLRGSGGRRKGT